MVDDGSASNPRDLVKSSGWNIAGQRRRQQAVMVWKKRRELLIWAKRKCKVGTNDSWRYGVFPSFRGEDVCNSFLSHLRKELHSKSITTFSDHEIERSRPIAQSIRWCVGWNVAGQRRRQQAVMVSKKRRELLIWAKRQCKVGINGDNAAEMMSDEEQPILEAHTNIPVEELKSAVQDVHLPKELNRETIDTSEEIKITSSMVSSSSRSWRYDVFPSFSGNDVRSSFLSHLLKELHRKLITTFSDHGIERSCLIGPELTLAIRKSRIAIVVFSKNYASSKWCLNELVEIHKCYKELNQMVIPIFYSVDPSEIRKQTGDFGNAFSKTCKGKSEDQKQRWMQALTDVANMAGEDLHNWADEAAMVEKIANDVSTKTFTPSKRFGDFLGIEAHLEAMNSKLCLESEEARMVGILGPSGIGKTTIGRELYRQLSSQFHHLAFVTYKRKGDVYSSKLYWEQQFLSEILGQKDLRIEEIGAVEQRLKDKKVLIVLDGVDDQELLKTLVGETGWFGSGSRIIVITQDRQLLKSHNIDLIYEVEFPSADLALEIFYRYAFGQKSPRDGFMELADEIAKLAGNLPLGLSVLGSSLRGRSKDEWVMMLPRLRNDLDGKIEKTLRVSYDRLDRKERKLFLYVAFACLFNGVQVSHIRDLLGDSVNIGLKMLAEKSLIRITPDETVEMHNLLQMLGREMIRAESSENPGKRQYLGDVEDICNVFTDKTGTETVLGIYLNISDIKEPLFIDENSFQGMLNLQHLIVIGTDSEGRLYLLPKGLTYLPRKLKSLKWDEYPSKCLPLNFKAEFLVELKMKESKLEKLWEGTQPIGRLKRMIMSGSRYLKEIPDLSKAINLEELYLSKCKSLVTLPSIQNAIKLRKLEMEDCTKLESLPTLLNCESLKYLNLRRCFRLRNFPQIALITYKIYVEDYKMEVDGYSIEVEYCLWNKNLDGVDYLDSLRRCIPSKFLPEHIVDLIVKGSMIEKLWEGVQSLGSLQMMDLSECGNLKEIPDLSKATNLSSLKLNNCKNLVTIPDLSKATNLSSLTLNNCKSLVTIPDLSKATNLSSLTLNNCKRLVTIPDLSKAINLSSLTLNNCKSLVTIPSTFGNLQKLEELAMKECTWLEVLPTDVNLSSLETLDLSGCKRLRSFPQISWSIKYLYLNDTAIEEVPSTFGNLQKLEILEMKGCTRLEVLPTDFNFSSLETLDLSGCKRLRSFPQISWSINYLFLNDTAIEEVPSTIGNLNRLRWLEMKECMELEVLPTDVNLSSLETLNLSGCKRLRSFPQISWSIKYLYLNDTAIEEVPCCIDNFSKLIKLRMRDCKRLKKSPQTLSD